MSQASANFPENRKMMARVAPHPAHGHAVQDFQTHGHGPAPRAVSKDHAPPKTASAAVQSSNVRSG
jgi:hypothetical protein